MSNHTDLEMTRREYQQRLPTLKLMASKLEDILNDLLADVSRIDKISVRAKDEERFVEKAQRLSEKSNTLKYKNPLLDIQDQIGARIVVYYRNDVDPVAERLLLEFAEIEDREVQALEPDCFSYEARHFICAIPPEISRTYKSPIDFFEIQVCTLFQHAWAEANHDLGYKPQSQLSIQERRQIAWAAAQAWGADQIFEVIKKQSITN